jgi:alkanesulfonate monooxygenase SsuD/methylene tetrahydromethanopterin reductase-like flavin-dependent oxidoreductase (luciferase family)
VRIGFHLTPFWSPTDRHPTRIIDEAIEVVGAASRMGYAWVSIGHHLLSYPTVWPQPLPMLARLAPETGRMRLKTSMLLLPLVDPVDVAENIATLDHITHGRLDVGVSIGYREKELETVGLGRRDRVPKLEESLSLMKRLWAGEEVTFTGRYARVAGGRMGLTPAQRPHPPIEMGAQSVGATSRALIVGPSREASAAAARDYLEQTFAMYRRWEMQESTMMDLQLSFNVPLESWAICGSPTDCVEAVARASALGLDRIGVTIYSLPRAPKARVEYLQMIAEEILRPADAMAT